MKEISRNQWAQAVNLRTCCDNLPTIIGWTRIALWGRIKLVSIIKPPFPRRLFLLMAKEVDMSPEEKNLNEKTEKEIAKKLAKKLDAIWWSLFFIWIGIVMITSAETAVAFLGIGIIMLGVQAARRYFQLRVEKFWTVVGLLFVGGGLWDTFDLNAPFAAVVLILVGVLILVSSLRKESSEKSGKVDTPEESSPED